jgi:hypothetical protein
MTQIKQIVTVLMILLCNRNNIKIAYYFNIILQKICANPFHL